MLLLLIAAALSKITSATECYSCASSALDKKWVFTHLPLRLPSTKFTDDCNNAAAVFANPALRSTCSGNCMTVLTQDPTTNVGTNLFVRGCDTELIGETAVRSPMPFCEQGEYTTMNGNAAVTPKMQLEICSTDLCNNGVIYRTDCPTSLAAMTCTCTNCPNDATTCTGSYCLHSNVDYVFSTTGFNQKIKSIDKYCLPISPYGRDVCKSTALPGPEFSGTALECFCRDHNNCNNFDATICRTNTEVASYCGRANAQTCAQQPGKYGVNCPITCGICAGTSSCRDATGGVTCSTLTSYCNLPTAAVRYFCPQTCAIC